MRFMRRALMAGALLAFGSASAASAATLATAPVPNNIPVVQTMYCDINNLDIVPRNVTIEIMDMNGVSLFGPLGPFLLQPGEGFAYPETTGIGAWCRFTVDGSAKKYRGVAVYDDATEYTASVPAQ